MSNKVSTTNNLRRQGVVADNISDMCARRQGGGIDFFLSLLTLRCCLIYLDSFFAYTWFGVVHYRLSLGHSGCMVLFSCAIVLWRIISFAILRSYLDKEEY